MKRGIKPFIKWVGGKRDELPVINQHMPDSINRYFEPFVGGGAVYLDVQANSYHINDKSNALIDLYRTIKSYDEEFIFTLLGLQKAWDKWESIEFFASMSMKASIHKYRETKTKSLLARGLSVADYEESIVKGGIYYHCRDGFNSGKGPVGRRSAYYFFILNYCYGGMNRYNSKGEFNVPYAGSYNSKKLDLGFLNNVNLQDKLSATTISNASYEAFIEPYSDLTSNDFMFIDPPYDSVFKNYESSTFVKQDQRNLGELLFSLPCKWMAVISDTPLIREIYEGRAVIIEYDKKYKTNINNSNSKRDVKHLMIMNY